MIRDTVSDVSCVACRAPLDTAPRVERVPIRVSRGEWAGYTGIELRACCVCGTSTRLLLTIDDEVVQI